MIHPEFIQHCIQRTCFYISHRKLLMCALVWIGDFDHPVPNVCKVYWCQELNTFPKTLRNVTSFTSPVKFLLDISLFRIGLLLAGGNKTENTSFSENHCMLSPLQFLSSFDTKEQIKELIQFQDPDFKMLSNGETTRVDYSQQWSSLARRDPNRTQIRGEFRFLIFSTGAAQWCSR